MASVMRVAFRADASVAIGTGHLMRCYALAEALRNFGAEIHFITRASELVAQEHLQAAGFSVHCLPTDKPADEVAEVASYLAETPGWDWLVIDHYGIDEQIEGHWRPWAKRIAVIDDLADRSHDCDLLIDQNHIALATDRYGSLVPPGCQLLLGPRYALIRSQFQEARDAHAREEATVRRILVSLGGSDPDNVALQVVRALQILDGTGVEIDVLAGRIGSYNESLRKLCAQMSYVRLHGHVDDPWNIMLAADMVIGAGGGSTWERCCLGRPSVVLSLADNQRENAHSMAEAGYFLYLGDADDLTPQIVQNTIACLSTNVALRKHFAQQGRSLVDGRGANRCAKIMSGMNVILRESEEQDCLAVLEWRNDAGTRTNSINSSLIDEREHRQWFARVLADSDRILLIAESGSTPVGALRYDINDGVALVSVFLVPGEQGKGFGTGILHSGESWLRTHRPEVCLLEAEVLEGSAASRQVFERAGFEVQRRLYSKNIASAHV